MVAKISSNTSLFGTLLYNKNKIDKAEATLLSTKNVYERADGAFSMQTTMKSFEPYLVANKRTEKPIFHVSLNPSPTDRLTDEQYKDIADKYMTDMGYQNQPYVVFKHTDIQRTHLHIVSTRVDENGKKLDSNFENMHSMKTCRQIEKDFNLYPATKQEQYPYELTTAKLIYKDGDVKKQIGNIAKTLLRNFHFQSIGEYNTLLEMFNVSAEEVKGTHNNMPYHGLIYSALDENKKKIGTPFKSSIYGKSINLNALEKHFEKSKQSIASNKMREYLRPIIAQVMSQARDPNELKLLLKEENMGVMLRQNENGRIYGVTFIDYNTKTVLNGSRLGKEFSANVFNELFQNISTENIENFPPINQSNNFSVQSSVQQDIGSNDFGLLDFEQHGTDYEAESFAQQKEKEAKIRKMKKKGRRMG